MTTQTNRTRPLDDPFLKLFLVFLAPEERVLRIGGLGAFLQQRTFLPFPLPFFDPQCLKLQVSRREQSPLRIHILQSPCLESPLPRGGTACVPLSCSRGGIQTQGMTSGSLALKVGQLPVIHTPWVVISVVSRAVPTLAQHNDNMSKDIVFGFLFHGVQSFFPQRINGS